MKVLDTAGGRLKWTKLTESVATKAPSELLPSDGPIHAVHRVIDPQDLASFGETSGSVHT